MLTALLTFFVIGLVGLVLLGVLLAAIGIVFKLTLGLAGFVLFRILPIVALGYLIVRFLRPRRPREPRTEAGADI